MACVRARGCLAHVFALVDRDDRTDDSDQMLLIMETIIELNGSVDERLFATKLKVRPRALPTHEHEVG
jgi:ADP-ribosylglycohydrolase